MPTPHSRRSAVALAVFGLGVVTSLFAGGDAPVARPGNAAHEWLRPADWYPTEAGRWLEPLPAGILYSEVRLRAGDDPAWAQPTCDDSAWEQTRPWDLPARHGIDWVRFRVRMGTDAQGRLPAGIMISTVRSYELFWDGVRLGSNGVPGNSAAEEVSGKIDVWFAIPEALLGPGEHVVALRTSSHRCGFPAPTSGYRFLVDSPGVLQRNVLREAFVPTVAAGALFMVGLASLIMWLLAARRRTLLLLCGLCLAGAAMQSLQAIRWFFAYPADWHYPVLSTMTVLLGAQLVLTVALVTELCATPRRRWVVGLVGPALVAVAYFSPARLNLDGVRILALGLGVSLACAAWGVWRRRRGGWAVAIGVAASFVLLVFQYHDYRASFFVKFLPALVGLIASLALQLRDERRDAHAARLAAARLEAELLKKNIQPHFLLNTLAVLAEIVEQDPRSAVKLIEDLADEFRAFARASAEKLIPLRQELDLCRAHLRVMSARTGLAWSLDVDVPDDLALVPPAVFLTLIENGFAHQRPAPGATRFTLQCRSTTGGVTAYRFFSPGTVKTDGGKPSTGIGLRYVKARLEESFPGRWTLDGQAVDGGWQTEIEIRATPEDASRPVAPAQARLG